MNKKFLMLLIAFLFLSFSNIFAQTFVVRGKLSFVNSTTVSCKGKKQSCGFYSTGPVKRLEEFASEDMDSEVESGYYYFPKDYIGKYPDGIKTDENGLKFIEKASFTRLTGQKNEDNDPDFNGEVILIKTK